MNILWLPAAFPFPADNGCKLVISNRIIQASRHGHRITAIIEGDNIEQDRINQMLTYCSECRIVSPPIRNKPFMIKNFVKSSYNLARYKNPKVTQAIIEEVKKNQYDVILVEMSELAINLIPIWEEIKNIHIIISEHNIESDAVKSKIYVKGVSLPKKIYSIIESSKLLKWERQLDKKENIVAYIFVTNNDKERFLELFSPSNSDRLFVSPIGTNMPQISNNCKDHKQLSILFPAAFDYVPNIHGAVWFAKEVAPKIIEQIPDVKIYFAGRNPTQEVRELASDNIVVTGSVPSMQPYFEMASAFIVPLFFGGGMKTKLVEMGCYGKPTITTSSGLIGTAYKDKQDLIVTDDPKMFSEYCIDMLVNKEKYSEMSENMKATTIQKYLWESIGDQLMEFLEQIVNNRASGEV